MTNRSFSVHHFIKAAILFGFAMYIVYLVKTDSILYYIAPRMVDYIKWSSIAFYAMAVYQVYAGVDRLWKKHEPGCDCGHDHTPSASVAKQTLIYGLFVFPLLLGFLLPDSTMGTSLAAKKGMNLSSSSSVRKDSGSTAQLPLTGTPSPQGNGQEQLNQANVVAPAAPAASPKSSSVTNQTSSPATSPVTNPTTSPSASPANQTATATDAKLEELFKSDKFTEVYANYGKKLYQADLIQVPEDSFIETLTTLDLYIDNFIGKKIQLDGFVYRQDDMKDHHFVVGRFAIQCCSADAAPYGILVEYDRAHVLATDSWIRATGTIQKTTYHDHEIMMLKLDKFAKIEEPKTQYVYPNYEFGY